MEEKKNREYRVAFLIFGAILVGVGVLFLLSNIIPYLGVAKLWPLFILIPVSILIAIWFQYKEKASGLILPIVILLFYSGYFFWLNFTSWSYTEDTWPNFLIGPGLGFMGLYFTTRKWEYLIPSFFLLIVAATFYAAIIENNLIVGILLISMGILVILKPFIMKEDKTKNS